MSAQDALTGRFAYQLGLEGPLSDGALVEVSDSPQPGRFLSVPLEGLISRINLRLAVPFNRCAPAVRSLIY